MSNQLPLPELPAIPQGDSIPLGHGDVLSRARITENSTTNEYGIYALKAALPGIGNKELPDDAKIQDCWELCDLVGATYETQSTRTTEEGVTTFFWKVNIDPNTLTDEDVSGQRYLTQKIKNGRRIEGSTGFIIVSSNNEFAGEKDFTLAA